LARIRHCELLYVDHGPCSNAGITDDVVKTR
jgi:hypothetical protein